MKKAKKILIFSVMAAALICIMIYYYQSKKMLVFKENLDKTAVTVDGKELSLEDIAFYIAYEETAIEEQAEIYSPENPNAYWNLHINGQFIQVAGKQAAMDMAIHDEIFYELALAEGLELSDEEMTALNSKESDFWSDLTEEQKERLGVSEDKILEAIKHLAMAEKYQTLLTEQSAYDGEDAYESYSITGENYIEILKDHVYEVNDKVWEKIDFGNVVVEH